MATILVIDDEPGILRRIKRALEAAGHEVVSYSNGRQGIERIEKETPVLAVTDIYMPEMEGLETVKRAHMLRPDMPIIAISGGSHSPVDYLDLGAVAILPKPFRPGALVALVSKLLEGANT